MEIDLRIDFAQLTLMNPNSSQDNDATTAQWGKTMCESPSDSTFVNSSVPKVIKDRVFLVGGNVQNMNNRYERGVKPLDLISFDLAGVSESGDPAVCPAPVEVYDPSNGHVPRRIGHVVEELLDGYLYVFGGQGIRDDAYLYENFEKEGSKSEQVPSDIEELSAESMSLKNDVSEARYNVLGDIARVKLVKDDGELGTKLLWEIVTPSLEVPKIIEDEDADNAESQDEGESAPPVPPATPCPRRWHASGKASAVDMVIVGGLDEEGAVLDDIYYYDALQNIWQIPDTTGTGPGGRFRHVMLNIPLTEEPPAWPPAQKCREKDDAADQADNEDEASDEVPNDEEVDTSPFVRATPGSIFARIALLGGDFTLKPSEKDEIAGDENEESSTTDDADGEENGAQSEMIVELDETSMSDSRQLFILTVSVADDGLTRLWTWETVPLLGDLAPMLSLRRWYQVAFARDTDINDPTNGATVPLIMVFGGRRREGMAPTNVLAINSNSGCVQTLAIRPFEKDSSSLSQTKTFNNAPCPPLLGHSMLSMDGYFGEDSSERRLSTVLVFGGWDGRQYRSEIASFELQKYFCSADAEMEKEQSLQDERTIKTSSYEYEGDTKVLGIGKVRHGKGRCTYVDSGNVYEGHWVNDMRNGNGSYLEKSTNDTYVGEWLNDERSGSGKQDYGSVDDDRISYTGSWAGGKYHGNGDLLVTGKCCKGVWENGKLKGDNGTLQYSTVPGATDSVYVGGLSIDYGTYIIVRSSFGKMTNKSKEVYDGGWRADKRHGKGTFYYKNGNTYIGNWSNDRKNGFGQMEFWNRDKYQGKWVGDKINGTGTMIYAPGHVYSGMWKDGVYHGRGRLSKKDGSITEGKWKEGKEVVVVSRKK